MCREGRPDETEWGVRVYAGTVCDAYLQRLDVQRGYVVAVWRGAHVAEPTDLDAKQAFDYWHELLTVARALERHFRPVKLNFNILGNSVPHLHTHVIPRYAVDPNPGRPFPFPEGKSTPIPEVVFRRDVAGLRLLLRDGRA